jgi:hypothetical protein
MAKRQSEAEGRAGGAAAGRAVEGPYQASPQSDALGRSRWSRRER